MTMMMWQHISIVLLLFLAISRCSPQWHPHVAKPLPSLFAGVECHSISPSSVCPMPHACCCNSTCIMWKRGELRHLPTFSSAADLATARLQLPAPCHIRNFMQASKSFFLNDTWTYAQHCSMTSYTPLETDLLLRGHSIVFYGDSLLRQLFNRLVWHLRGIDEVIEQYYHANAFYARNTTHDFLYIGPDDHMGTKHRLFSLKAKNLVDNPTLELIYIWEPRLEDPDHADTHLEWAKEDFRNFTLVMGLNHWFAEDDFQTKLVLPQIERFQNPTKYPHLNFMWYPTPSNTYWQRNQFFQKFVNGSKSWILPTELMANASTYLHNRGDYIHYQCGFNVKFPSPIENMDRFNIPESRDCRDMFEFNIMQVMLNIFAMQEKTGHASHRLHHLHPHHNAVNNNPSLPH